MIPLAHVTQWSANAPWPDMRQVEQDLIICRAICELLNHPKLKGRIAFRGARRSTNFSSRNRCATPKTLTLFR